MRLCLALLIVLSAVPSVARAQDMEDWIDVSPGTTHTPAPLEGEEDMALKGLTAGRSWIWDSDHFKRDVTSIGTALRFKGPDDFISIGIIRNDFRQGDWSEHVNSIGLAYRNVNRQTAAGLTARFGISTNTSRARLHGDLNWNIRFSGTTGMELIFNQDAMDSVEALKHGILSTFIAASFDHTIGERFTVIAMPTYRHFSDGAEQFGGRGWLIYSLVPRLGLSVALHARMYDRNGAGSPFYFSPGKYRRVEAGLRLRRSIGDWRVFASVNIGREYIDSEGNKPTQTASLRVTRIFANRIGVAGEVATYRAAGDSHLGSAGDYRWNLARVIVAIPLG